VDRGARERVNVGPCGKGGRAGVSGGRGVGGVWVGGVWEGGGGYDT
jgi:hypothetical protein